MTDRALPKLTFVTMSDEHAPTLVRLFYLANRAANTYRAACEGPAGRVQICAGYVARDALTKGPSIVREGDVWTSSIGRSGKTLHKSKHAGKSWI